MAKNLLQSHKLQSFINHNTKPIYIEYSNTTIYKQEFEFLSNVYDDLKPPELQRIAAERSLCRDQCNRFDLMLQDTEIDSQRGYVKTKSGKMRLGRFLRKKLIEFNRINKDGFPESEFDNCLSDIQIELWGLSDDDFIVEIMPATKAYDMVEGTGSCMEGKAHPERLHFMDWYDENNVKALVITLKDKDGKPQYGIAKKQARCLLWNDTEGRQLADKIYDCGNALLNKALKAWCKENNIYYRFESPTQGTVFQINDNNRIDITDIRIRMNYSKSSCYPYLDTFRSGKDQNNSILLMNTSYAYNVIYTFDSISGNVSGMEDSGCYTYTCCDCGRNIANDPDDVYRCPVDEDSRDILCGNCHDERHETHQAELDSVNA